MATPVAGGGHDDRRNRTVRAERDRAYQDILAKGRKECREQGVREEAAELVLRLLRRRFGSVTAEQDATIRGLTTAQLEDLAEALLEFGSPLDMEAWLDNRRGD